MATLFKLLRSDTAHKRPTSAQLSVGELGLNYDSSSLGLFIEDDGGAVRKIGPMEVGSSAPNSSPAGSSGNSTGELWLDNSTGHVLKYYTGSGWTAITNTGEAGSDTQVLFNDGGSYAGDANFTFDKDTDVLSVTEVEGRLDGAVVFEAKSAGALSKGDVVYVSSVSGNFPVVDKARADSTSTMPAFGLANNSTSGADETVVVVTLGTLKNVDTDTPGYTLGDTLYVSATTAGVAVNTPPTGEGNLIQNIGKVQRVQSSSGEIKVGGAGRTNATPNLNDGKIFIGNGSNQTTTSTFAAALSAQAGISSTADAVAITIDSSERVGIGTTSPTAKLDISGDGANSSRVFLTQANDTTDGTDITGRRARGTVASPTSLQASDTVFKLFAQAYDGSAYVAAGNMGWTAADGSGNASFSIRTRSGSSLGDRLVINGSGNVSLSGALTVNNDLEVGGNLIQTPGGDVTPSSNGDLVVEATSNTTLTFKLKGDDGTVRTGTITLS